MEIVKLMWNSFIKTITYTIREKVAFELHIMMLTNIFVCVLLLYVQYISFIFCYE